VLIHTLLVSLKDLFVQISGQGAALQQPSPKPMQSTQIRPSPQIANPHRAFCKSPSVSPAGSGKDMFSPYSLSYCCVFFFCESCLKHSPLYCSQAKLAIAPLRERRLLLTKNHPYQIIPQLQTHRDAELNLQQSITWVSDPLFLELDTHAHPLHISFNCCCRFTLSSQLLYY
jgi:hypothetical protein